MARSFLKWAGGKRGVLDQIRPHFPTDYKRYVEPFLGGGAVFFDLLPEEAILSDSNKELINTFIQIKKSPNALMRLLDGMLINERTYYEIKAQNLKNLSVLGRAARFIYLNKLCFNGLYRVNKQNKFNVPWGKYKNPTLFKEENLKACSKALSKTSLLSFDFEKTCWFCKPGDLVYFDPPYIPVSETSNFTAFTSKGFDIKDQKRLADLATRLVLQGIQVMASNSNTELSKELWITFNAHEITTRRSISCTNRPDIKELFFTSW